MVKTISNDTNRLESELNYRLKAICAAETRAVEAFEKRALVLFLTDAKEQTEKYPELASEILSEFFENEDYKDGPLEVSLEEDMKYRLSVLESRRSHFEQLALARALERTLAELENRKTPLGKTFAVMLAKAGLFDLFSLARGNWSKFMIDLLESQPELTGPVLLTLKNGMAGYETLNAAYGSQTNISRHLSFWMVGKLAEQLPRIVNDDLLWAAVTSTFMPCYYNPKMMGTLPEIPRITSLTTTNEIVEFNLSLELTTLRKLASQNSRAAEIVLAEAKVYERGARSANNAVAVYAIEHIKETIKEAIMHPARPRNRLSKQSSFQKFANLLKLGGQQPR